MDHIPHAPKHPLLIRNLANIVIRTDDVEPAILHLLIHVLCNLRRMPGATRLRLRLASRAGRVAGLKQELAGPVQAGRARTRQAGETLTWAPKAAHGEQRAIRLET